MTRLDRGLLALALLGAIGWGTVNVAYPRAGAFWPLKALSVPPLVLLAWRRRERVPGASLLAAALAAHAAGDVLLVLAPLLAGVAAFAVGHLLFVALFWRYRVGWDEVRGGAKLRLGLLALAGALMLSLLRGGLRGSLALAVPGYAMTLLAMAAMAQVARRGQPFVAAGAFAFVLSDALLGLVLFRHFDGGAPLAWPLYVLAQGSIALGWLFGREPRSASAEAAP
jgi:uncharacterized membrane protein YhhN